MKVFVLGAACAGKTTLCRHLRVACRVNGVDVNDEILRLNDGVWPSIDRKNEVLLPMVLDAVIAMPEVVAFNSYMPVEGIDQLRRAGFRTVLLEVSEAELRRRHDVRLAVEGWTNVEWFDWNQSHIRELRDNGQFDHVISGEADVEVVATEILRFAQRDGTTGRIPGAEQLRRPLVRCSPHEDRVGGDRDRLRMGRAHGALL